MKYLLLLTILLTSCTVTFEESKEIHETLNGTWKENKDGCSDFLMLSKDQYRLGTMCELDNGKFGADVEFGTYELTKQLINLEPEYDSCPASSFLSPREYTFLYKDQSIYMGDIKYIKIKNTTIFFGCWTNGEFKQTNVLFPVLED